MPFIMRGQRTSLPAEGQKIVEAFDTDRAAIQEEADRKIDARHETLVKTLQDLQEQYARAGKLDEAVAIRDFLRTVSRGRLTPAIRRVR